MKTIDEVANAFNRSTNLSDQFIISQYLVGAIVEFRDKNAKDPLNGFEESLTQRANELYYRYFK